MKINYRFYNATILGAIIFVIQQTKLLTISRFYVIIMLLSGFLLMGFLTKRNFIYKLSKTIDELFDSKDINIYQDGVKLILAITIFLLLCHFPLLLFLNKTIIHLLLVITTSLFIISYSLIAFYLIISIKSFAYSTSNDERNIQSSSTSSVQEIKYFITSEQPKQKLINTFKNITPTVEEKAQPPIKENNAILKEIYLPRDIRLYVPFFIIIDKLFISRDRENNSLSNEFYKLLTNLTGGKHDSIRKKFNELQYTESINSKIESINKALNFNGNKPITKIEKYQRMGFKLLERFNSTYFKISEKESEEFVVLCVIYFTVFIEENKSPSLENLLNDDLKKSLQSKLKKFLKN